MIKTLTDNVRKRARTVSIGSIEFPAVCMRFLFFGKNYALRAGRGQSPLTDLLQ